MTSSRSMYRRDYELVACGDGELCWWDPQAAAIKWIVFTSLFFLIMFFLGFGYIHAQRRIKKGLKPLAYHRWLVPHWQRHQSDPRFQHQFTFYQAQQQQQNPAAYGMNSYSAAPPPYNPAHAPPPTYQPPTGGTKTDPNQERYSQFVPTTAAGPSAPVVGAGFGASSFLPPQESGVTGPGLVHSPELAQHPPPPPMPARPEAAKEGGSNPFR